MADFSLGTDLTAAGQGISAVGSLFGSQVKASGYQQEANLYGQAANLENLNELYAESGTGVKEALTARQANKVIGAQEAAVGAHGFENAGSNLYLLRDSQAQAGIARGMVNVQGGIEAANFQEQELGLKAQQAGAQAAANAASTGGILGALSSVAGIAATFLK